MSSSSRLLMLAPFEVCARTKDGEVGSDSEYIYVSCSLIRPGIVVVEVCGEETVI